MSNARNPFRLNVGFILHEDVGSSHEFSFDLPRARVGDDLELRLFNGALSVGRTAQGLLLTGGFSGVTELTCVRCLRAFDQTLSWKLTEVFALSKKTVSESGLIVPEDAQLDLQPILRDYALLEVPIKPLCRRDCRGLCPVCGQDLNVKDCGHRPSSGDSPFAVLEDLLKE